MVDIHLQDKELLKHEPEETKIKTTGLKSSISMKNYCPCKHS